MVFSRQEYWSELPRHSLGYLPDPGIEPGSPTLQAHSSLSEPPGSSPSPYIKCKIKSLKFEEKKNISLINISPNYVFLSQDS